MFLIPSGLAYNPILRCYFHQLLIWERTASPRPRWRSANAELRLDLKSVAAPAKHTGEALCAAAKHRSAAALNMQAVPSAHDPTHFAYDSDICKPGFFVDASNVIRGGSVKQQMGGVYQPQMCNVSILKMQSRRIKFDLEESVNQCRRFGVDSLYGCMHAPHLWAIIDLDQK